MSKPEGAMEIPIPSDLSEAALETAQEELGRVCNAKHPFWTLKVPSQTARTALLLTIDRKIYVELDCEYDSDEWSLKLTAFDDGDSLRIRDYEIWSPGA